MLKISENCRVIIAMRMAVAAVAQHIVIGLLPLAIVAEQSSHLLAFDQRDSRLSLCVCKGLQCIAEAACGVVTCLE